MYYREFLEDQIDDIRDLVEVDGAIVPAVTSGSPDDWSPDESWCEVLLPDWKVRVPWSMVDPDEYIDLEFKESFSGIIVVDGVLRLKVVLIDTDGFDVSFDMFDIEDIDVEDDIGDYDCDYDYDCDCDCDGSDLGWKE